MPSENSGGTVTPDQCKENAKLVQTATVDNGATSLKRREATVSPPTNLPVSCAQKEVQTKGLYQLANTYKKWPGK